uniref:Uncharacterized protein n=1 Tax=Anopheles melas TaxID=34690 RepID=A0A182UKU3_9DIPT
MISSYAFPESQYCPPVGFYPGAPPANPQDNRPPPQPQILYPYQSSLTIPMRQYVDIPSQPGPMVQPKPEQLIVSGKVGPLPPSQANLYHIPTLDHTVAAMHGQQPPMKTITIEKIPQERLVPYHIELVKHDERKDLRQLQGVPPQAQPPPGVVATHLPEGIVYAPSLRPAAIQMHTIATNQQLPKSGSITQGYPSARPPPISNPQQQPPPQMHYSRHRSSMLCWRKWATSASLDDRSSFTNVCRFSTSSFVIDSPFSVICSASLAPTSACTSSSSSVLLSVAALLW